MSEIRPDCLYTKDHEWIKKTDKPKVVVVGITDFAQASLGDVTYLELPAVGRSFRRGEILGTVESVKAVSDIYAPVSGVIHRVNQGLVQDPATLNSDPFGSGWLIELEISNDHEFTSLLTPDAYNQVAQ